MKLKEIVLCVFCHLTMIFFGSISNADGLHYSSGLSNGTAGFNLADVSSVSQLNALPDGMKGLVYLGMCNGADSTFVNAVKPYAGNPKLFGFYLFDEPDPTGQWNTLCKAGNLMAESDYIHQNLPGAKTFVVLMNFGSVLSNPTYTNTYNPANTHIDLFGLDPYPCRSKIGGCQLNAINLAVSAANAAGIPSNQIVPVYQSFGCRDGQGSCTTDSGDYYLVPSATQMSQMIATWSSLVPNPAFDYAYTWAISDIQVPLSQLPDLQAVFATHNTSVTETPVQESVPEPTPAPVQTADTVAPSVTLTSPANGALVMHSSKITITAGASDNVGVAHVDFYVDDTRVCSVSQAPYICVYKTPRRVGRTIKIQAWSFDAAGNEGGSSIVKVKTK